MKQNRMKLGLVLTTLMLALCASLATESINENQYKPVDNNGLRGGTYHRELTLNGGKFLSRFSRIRSRLTDLVQFLRSYYAYLYEQSLEAEALPYLPSDAPSDIPSNFPSSVPSDVPTLTPSDIPSLTPSDVPSSVPSDIPSLAPSDVPSLVPSDVPSLAPSDVPSLTPSDVPSMVPSDVPSLAPSDVPSLVPSDVPSLAPSSFPSDFPSLAPSDFPSMIPSDLPSTSPTEVQEFTANSISYATCPASAPLDLSTLSDLPLFFGYKLTIQPGVSAAVVTRKIEAIMNAALLESSCNAKKSFAVSAEPADIPLAVCPGWQENIDLQLGKSFASYYTDFMSTVGGGEDETCFLVAVRTNLLIAGETPKDISESYCSALEAMSKSISSGDILGLVDGAVSIENVANGNIIPAFCTFLKTVNDVLPDYLPVATNSTAEEESMTIDKDSVNIEEEEGDAAIKVEDVVIADSTSAASEEKIEVTKSERISAGTMFGVIAAVGGLLSLSVFYVYRRNSRGSNSAINLSSSVLDGDDATAQSARNVAGERPSNQNDRNDMVFL